LNKNVSPAVLRNSVVFTALFAALISVTCIVAIPAGPLGVPIVMQNIIAILAGAVLGPLRGAAAVLLFLICGALGLPVFSGGTGGIARFFGPTGGFLAGYFLGALVCGLLLGAPRQYERRSFWRVLRTALALFAGNVMIYIAGLAWLTRTIMITNLNKNIPSNFFDTLPAAISTGLLPFIPGFIIKFIIALPLTLALRPVAARYICPDE
jgi:biotin transport system substrate-specific component